MSGDPGRARHYLTIAGDAAAELEVKRSRFLCELRRVAQEVLRGAGVSDTVAVVTRWFGGVLLGAGGLVRAYGDAVRAALEEAGTLTRERVADYAVRLDHADAGRVEGELRSRGVPVLGVEYADVATLRLGVPLDEAERLRSWLAELTAGAAAPVLLGERWVDRPES